jgi:hypothetical protein
LFNSNVRADAAATGVTARRGFGCVPRSSFPNVGADRGEPPKLATWIKGVKFLEYTDTEKRLADKGGIALQVHGGDYTKQFVRHRNIRVKELKK